MDWEKLVKDILICAMDRNRKICIDLSDTDKNTLGTLIRDNSKNAVITIYSYSDNDELYDFVEEPTEDEEAAEDDEEE